MKTMFSEKTRAPAAWCTVSQAFRSAPQSSWKSFSSGGVKARRAVFGRLATSSDDVKFDHSPIEKPSEYWSAMT